MSVLVDRDILEAMRDGVITVEPFDEASLGTNSYDVHLAPTLRTYKVEFESVVRPRDDGFYGSPPGITKTHKPLDVGKPRATIDHSIGPEGFVLEPGELYLASTVEYTESLNHVPILNGKSSLGRLGLSIHVTAGTGDVGFRNHWTMELFVVKPLRIYAGMAIGQLLWFSASDEPLVPYTAKRDAKYNDRSALPQASAMFRNFSTRKEV